MEARPLVRWAGGTMLVVWCVAAACRMAPSAGTLEADNPIRPAAGAPFGLEDFFAEAPREPDRATARLGRWLFFDTRLSADGTVSCATCHRPDYAFSEPTPTSTGMGGHVGRRKAPSIVNLAARTVLVDTPEHERAHAFFWDGRAIGLEAQVAGPMADPAEMGLPPADLVDRLSRIRGYRPYFAQSFSTTEVTPARVAAALADYVRTLRAGNSPYDRWSYRGESAALSTAAQRGSDVFSFKGRCAVCHAGFNFSDGRFHNLGVGWDDRAGRFRDVGRVAVTGAARDHGAFKTPGLRDVAKHAPYMHDGSLSSLREVVEFYNRGGNANPWRSRRLVPLGLTSQDVDDLVAFLTALNSDGVADVAPRYFPQ